VREKTEENKREEREMWRREEEKCRRGKQRGGFIVSMAREGLPNWEGKPILY